MSFILVYTRTNKWLISNEHVDREVWSAKLYWFLAGVSYETSEALAEFLRIDFHLSEENKNYIISSLASEAKTYELEISEDEKVSIKQLQMDLYSLKVNLLIGNNGHTLFPKF